MMNDYAPTVFQWVDGELTDSDVEYISTVIRDLTPLYEAVAQIISELGYEVAEDLAA